MCRSGRGHRSRRVRAGHHGHRLHRLARRQDHRPRPRTPGAGLLNAGQDPRHQIARRLNGIEEPEGFERLADALRATLDLGRRRRSLPASAVRDALWRPGSHVPGDPGRGARSRSAWMRRCAGLGRRPAVISQPRPNGRNCEVPTGFTGSRKYSCLQGFSPGPTLAITRLKIVAPFSKPNPERQPSVRGLSSGQAPTVTYESAPARGGQKRRPAKISPPRRACRPRQKVRQKIDRNRSRASERRTTDQRKQEERPANARDRPRQVARPRGFEPLTFGSVERSSNS
jgi:hypothetical protein